MTRTHDPRSRYRRKAHRAKVRNLIAASIPCAEPYCERQATNIDIRRGVNVCDHHIEGRDDASNV